MTIPALERQIASLPAQPGVYIFRGPRGDVLYVGKAKRLDQRVRSHFQDPVSIGPKQVALVRRVADVEYIAVESEIDALLLEATLVREKQPPYNINLKDDKRYPYIRVSWQEPFPKMTLVRRTAKDGARYFGPYTEVKGLRTLLRLTQTIFPMRSCRDIDAHIAANRECLDFHIGRCTGPCIGAQSQAEYRAMVDRFCDFLSGRREQVVERMRGMLSDASTRREYERAGDLRDQIRRLEQVLARQRMVDVGGEAVDLLGWARAGGTACVTILQVRERRVLSRDVRWLKGAGDADDDALLRAFLPLYYDRADAMPATVVVDATLAERDLLEGALTRRAGSPVRLRGPRGATETALSRMARRNAALLLAKERGEGSKGLVGSAGEEALHLERVLGLPAAPRRVRCFDVSNLFGTFVVASMVTFLDGRPHKSEYRRFRIRAVEGQDDFASIAEAVRRHAARVDSGEVPPADLYVIDGGPGQLAAARAAAQGTRLANVPFIGLAKRLEEIVLPDRAAPLRLPKSAPGLRQLMRIRDEAHRFAVTYHRTLRGGAATASALDRVPGLGPKRRAALLKRFGSPSRLRRQPVEAIAALPGIGPRLAARILSTLAAPSGVGEGGR
ncbi:MAG TPA: excinuclease ABC subunit UvrC [Candidatus Eisenbacteria bacterium]|nr:excinuclease ABC subunit UvrC [Candidatus Eisenbacteria bacterium]